MLGYVQIRRTAWESFVAGISPNETQDAIEKMVKQGRAFTGFWLDQGGFLVVSMVGEYSDFDALVAKFDPADVGQQWRWFSDGQVDAEYEYPGQHDDLLALQKGTPTFETPNWGCFFAGFGRNEFARAYAMGFSKGFD